MKPIFYIDGNVEIMKNGQLFMNSKRYTLLRFIDEYGSINAASKQLQMSYQQAWHYIKIMNELSPLPVVVRKRGGANGGGAELTSTGMEALGEFKRLLDCHSKFLSSETEKLKICSFDERYSCK